MVRLPLEEQLAPAKEKALAAMEGKDEAIHMVVGSGPSILLKAHELVNGPRAQSYGSPETNFQRWSDLLRPLEIHLSPYQLALVMVAGKLARQANAVKEDNLVDAAGYLEIAQKLAPQ